MKSSFFLPLFCGFAVCTAGCTMAPRPLHSAALARQWELDDYYARAERADAPRQSAPPAAENSPGLTVGDIALLAGGAWLLSQAFSDDSDADSGSDSDWTRSQEEMNRLNAAHADRLENQRAAAEGRPLPHPGEGL